MRPLSYYLRRLRHLGAPPGGPGRQLAVPRPGEDPAAEIAPLHPDLDAIEEEALAIVAQARARAAKIEEDAQRQAQVVLARADRQVDQERTEIIAAELAAAEIEASTLLAKAHAQAKAVEQQAAAQAPRLVQEVIAELVDQPC